MLERVGLAGAGKRRVGNYSLGMRQRLGIGSALIGDPADPGAGRAGQRDGPRGHPVDAGTAAGLRLSRRHGAAVQPPARRGAGHRRPAGRHRERSDRRRRVARGTAGRRPHRRPRTGSRRLWRGLLQAAGHRVERRPDGAHHRRRHCRAGRPDRRGVRAGAARAAGRRRRRPGGPVLHPDRSGSDQSASRRHDAPARPPRRTSSARSSHPRPARGPS